jgi:hypothetical protein
MGILGFLASLGALSDCSKSTSLFKITSMSFSPDPPISGQNSTLLLSMNVPTQVSGGTATYSLTYNFIPLSPSVEDLCKVLPSGCPIMAGKLDTVSNIPFDTSLKGSIRININWKDTANNELMCVSINTKI